MKRIALRTSRLPDCFKQDIPDAITLERFRSLKRQGINTVCLEAKCPNWASCISSNTLTFMILGNYCTRNCRFCAVGKSESKTLPLDKHEPYRILKVIKEFGLKFIIITSVSRDDLADGGAGEFARTINIIRSRKKYIRIEVLIPDFLGFALKRVVEALPDVLAHNLETVPRLYPQIRKGANYSRSLQVLAQSKEFNANLITKSSVLLGMSETEQEVIGVMDDLVKVGCDILVLGQYLSPSLRHYPVKEYINSRQFQRYKRIGLAKGFKEVLASPLARTSYKAQEVYNSVTRIDYSV